MAGLDITQDTTLEPISLARAKRQCQIDASLTDDDEYLYDLISSARQIAEEHTARSYITRTFREYYDGFPGLRLPIPFEVVYDLPVRHEFDSHHRGARFELSRSPLQSVSQIQYLDQTGTTQTLDPSLYYVSPWREPAKIGRAPGSEWPVVLQQPDSVWVDYTAGYGAPQTVSLSAGTAIVGAATFPASAVNASISIPCAAIGGGPLNTTIASVAGGVATLAVNAGVDVDAATAWLGKPLPPIAARAMLLLITHWYENRLPIAQANLAELPYTIRGLLDRNRVYYQA